MSKFKCTENSRDFVEVLRDKEGRPALTVGDNHSASVVFLSPSDAPALALAILEAAGVVHHDPDDTPYEKSERTENMGALNMSAFYLAKHVNDAEKAEFLAKEQAKLEAEALELYNVGASTVGIEGSEVLNDLRLYDQKVFLAIARKAREMRAEK